MTIGLYTITAPSGNRYVGQSVRCETRLQEHKRDLTRGTHCNTSLAKAYKKYDGRLIYKVVCSVPKEHLDEAEQLIIDMLAGRTYNQAPVLAQGYMSFELREKLKAKSAERFAGPKERERLSRQASEINSRPHIIALRKVQAIAAHAKPENKIKYSEGAKRAWLSQERQNKNSAYRKAARLARIKDLSLQYGLLLLTDLGLSAVINSYKQPGYNHKRYLAAAAVKRALRADAENVHKPAKERADERLINNGLLLLTKKGLQALDSQYQKAKRKGVEPTAKQQAASAALSRMRYNTKGKNNV
jgi:GIY-YIG catalytic domain